MGLEEELFLRGLMQCHHPPLEAGALLSDWGHDTGDAGWSEERGRTGYIGVGEQGPRARLWAGSRGRGQWERAWNRGHGVVTLAAWGQGMDIGV